MRAWLMFWMLLSGCTLVTGAFERECGDGFLQGPEEACDDGNLGANDGCDELCVLEFCGDGVVNNVVEECDATGGCRDDCTLEVCGDAIQDPGEACDDGNLSPNDGCDELCVVEFCGDGVVNNVVEECDEGNNSPLDLCDDACQTIIPAGPAAVDLGSSGDFVILTQAGIDTLPPSVITGDIGALLGAGAGFGLIADGSGEFSTSAQVFGEVFASTDVEPTPSTLDTAVLDMGAAFADAAGRPTPDFTELSGGVLSGNLLLPGLYKWGTAVTISTNITLDGGPNDVWIFQITGAVSMAANVRVELLGGARPENIFWQVIGAVGLGAGAQLEGIMLSQGAINLGSGAVVNGRLLSVAAITLDKNIVTQP